MVRMSADVCAARINLLGEGFCSNQFVLLSVARVFPGLVGR